MTSFTVSALPGAWGPSKFGSSASAVVHTREGGPEIGATLLSTSNSLHAAALKSASNCDAVVARRGRSARRRVDPRGDHCTSRAMRGSADVRFSNRPFRVKRFLAIHRYGVDVAHGLVLLFGIAFFPCFH